MTAKKSTSKAAETDTSVFDSLSFAIRRRDRGEIVDAAIRGLKNDLEEIRKLTLNA